MPSSHSHAPALGTEARPGARTSSLAAAALLALLVLPKGIFRFRNACTGAASCRRGRGLYRAAVEEQGEQAAAAAAAVAAAIGRPQLTWFQPRHTLSALCRAQARRPACPEPLLGSEREPLVA